MTLDWRSGVVPWLLLLGLLALLTPVACDEETAPPPEWPWAKYGIPQTTNPCAIPTKRTDWAYDYHLGMLQQKLNDLPLIFLGDSITMMWRSQSGYEGGTPVWEKYYKPLNSGNFGISGDETQNILWRITEGGDLDGISPKVLVLLIGVNNLLGVHGAATPEQVAEGITAIVNYLKVKLPTTKILLLAVFPCWEQPTNPAREKVRQTNELILPLEDREQVYYLDMGQQFLEPDGTIKQEKLRDFLHLSEIGYGIWAETMQPYLEDLINNEGKGEVWGKRGEGKTA